MSSGTTTSSMRVQRNMGPSYQALSPVPCRPVPCGANSNPSGQSGPIQPMSVELHTGMGFMVHSDPGGKVPHGLNTGALPGAIQGFLAGLTGYQSLQML